MSDLAERRQEEKAQRRADILDAAEQVAAETGIDAMTMDQVARRARLSRALLYVYFEDKPDLLFGICSRALDELHQRFDRTIASSATGLEQVEACGRAYIAFAREAPLRFEALARFEAHTLPAGIASGNEGGCVLAGDRVHAVLIGAIERGIGDGSIRPDIGSPAMTSFALWGALHGAIQLGATKAAALAHAGIDGAQLIEQCLLMLGRSLARPG
jgi:TetR/AcrR family transcriptional regulator